MQSCLRVPLGLRQYETLLSQFFSSTRRMASKSSPAHPSLSLPNNCVGCDGLTATLSADEVQNYAPLIPDWKINDDSSRLTRILRAKNFACAMNFLMQIGCVSEVEGHHPDVHLYGYNNVQIDLRTHKLGGLTTNDIVLAIKIDAIQVEKSRRAAEPMGA